MNKITSSGLYGDDFGQLVLVTQGLGGYTLVAQKKILFRLFLETAPNSVTAVLATIKFKIGRFTITKNILVPAGSLLFETATPNGPSIGILFTGDAFPVAGTYEVAFSVQATFPSTPHFKLTELVFLPSGRLRVLIHNLVGIAPWGTNIQPNPDWLIEIFQALQRFSPMLPIRDGLKLGLTHNDVGLCFSFGENIDPWNCPSGPCTDEEKKAKMVRETREINSRGTSEHVDATICWRPRDVTKFPPPGGESAGGKALPDAALASFVGGNEGGREKTGSVMAQEVGHIFGLEPPDSPHFDGGGHSRNRAVVDPFAFDFFLLKPYQPAPSDFIGDVMGIGWHQGRDMVLFNAFDWEHLRKMLTQLPGAFTGVATNGQLTEKERDELVDDFQRIFAEEPLIKLANLAMDLATKDGLTWQWTARGFEQLQNNEAKKARSGLAPSVEGIRSWIEALGIDEVYTPRSDRPLHLIINPNAKSSLPEEELDLADQSEGERLTPES